MNRILITKIEEFESFLNCNRNMRLVCYGAGRLLIEFAEHICPQYQLGGRISYIADSSPALDGSTRTVNGHSIEVISLRRLIDLCQTNEVVLCITSLSDEAIFKQLAKVPELSDVDCCSIASLAVYEQTRIALTAAKPPAGFRKNENPQVPKTLNYAWFGEKPIPDKNRRLIETWRKHCPGYTVVEWNERNYDVTKHPFMHAAYKAGRFAFAADYAKLDLAYNNGGIFLDVDVEIIKGFDELLYNTAFCGFHNYREVAFGLGFGTIAGLTLIGELLSMYDGLTFSEDNMDKLACNLLQTEGMAMRGLRLDGSFQVIGDISVYPVEFFNPILFTSNIPHVTENTYAIHYGDVSWEDEKLSGDRAHVAAQILRLVEERAKWSEQS